MLLHSVVITTFFSCSKKDFQETQDTSKSAQEVSLSSSTTLNANWVYRESFEGSTYFPLSGTDIDKTSSIENCNSGSIAHGTAYDWTLATATNPVFENLKTSRFEIRKDQPLVGSSQRIRSEVVIIKGSTDSRFTPDFWYSFAIYFPSKGSEADPTHETINQWYEDGGDDCTIKTRNGKAYLEMIHPTTSSLNRYDLFGGTNSAPTTSTSTVSSSFTSIPRDSWHTFVFHYIHSQSSDGLIEIWRDGVKIQTISGRNMHTSTYPKWKLGIYKSDFANSTMYSRVLYFDDVRIGKKGSTVADMTSGTATTTNVPPTANAGSDISITLPNNSISLTGKAADSDGTIASTTWTKVSGPAATFTGENTLTPTVSGLTAGIYTFRLTVTDDKGATATDDVNVSVLDVTTSTLSIKDFTLINASTEKDILTIGDGATISLKQLGVSKLNIRANPNSTMGSVKFELSGAQSKTSIDNAVPYALMGDNGTGNYYYGTWGPPAVGTYTLKATPYSAAQASGTAGNASIIHFTITN